MMRILSWNVGRRDLWRQVADAQHDVALLQEAGAPPDGVGLQVLPAPGDPWEAGIPEPRAWRTAVAARPGVTMRPYPIASRHRAGAEVLGVSRPGTLTLAGVSWDGEPPLTVASVYGTWESPLDEDGLIYSDASAHQLLGDLAQLVTSRDRHRLIVAGDWNLLLGYAEDGDPYWAARAQSVFDRAAAMGLVYVGPQAPNGRQPDPWPSELPRSSRNVPTFHDDQQSPAEATRQLDHVFASASIAGRVQASALNAPEEWGPSDHCRLSITVDL
jgi:exonuclease III